MDEKNLTIASGGRWIKNGQQNFGKKSREISTEGLVRASNDYLAGGERRGWQASPKRGGEEEGGITRKGTG